MMRIVILLCVVLLALVEPGCAEADHHGSGQVSGRVVIARRVTVEVPRKVNKGGLIIVQIDDRDGRQATDIKVTALECEPLGNVRGNSLDPDTGRPLKGNDYTWYLFKAPVTGDVNIQVTEKFEDKAYMWSPDIELVKEVSVR